MRLIYAGLAAASAFGAAASAAEAGKGTYVEVSGRLENLDYQSIYDPDDLLGHGWMTAKLHVARVWSGPKLPRVITVRYFGHGFIKDGRKMRLTLRRGDDGVYLVCAPAGGTGVQCP